MSNVLNSVLAGYEAGQQMRAQRAQQDQMRRAEQQRNELARYMGQGDFKGAANAAFQSGDVDAGMQITKMLQDMDAAQAAKAREQSVRLAGVAQSIIETVPDDQIDRVTREQAITLNIPPEILPTGRMITRSDLQSFVYTNQALAGELDKVLERQQVELGQNEQIVRRQAGGVDRTVNTLGERIQGEAERAARADERLRGFSNETARMNAQTAREKAMQPAGQNEIRLADGTVIRTQMTPKDAYTANRSQLVVNAIDRAVRQAGEPLTTGLPGGVAGRVWGSPAYDLRATIDQVVAHIGFSELQAMRDNSPTGGALGQVTERELAFLQSVLGSLDNAQSREQLLENLQIVRQQYAKTIDALRAEYAAAGIDIFAGAPMAQTQPAQQQSELSPQEAAELEALRREFGQ